MSVFETSMPDKLDVSSRRAIIGSIAVSIAFVMELTLVPLVLPAIQTEFGLTVGQLAWVFNSYGISVALGVLLGGLLGDLFGIRKVFRTGVLFFASGAFIVAFAQNYETVLTGRVLQGFGGGVFSPLVPLLLTRALPQRPGKILIIWGSIAGYVAAFAPLGLSRALSEFGWQSAFILFAIASIVALAIMGKLKKGTHEHLPQTLPNLTKILRVRRLWLVYGYIFCTYGSIIYYLFKLPLWLADLGYGVMPIGLVLSMIWLSFSVAGTLLRNWVDSHFIRAIMLVAPLVIAASFPVAYFADNIVWFMLSAALLGTGFATSNAPSTQMVLKFAPLGMSAISTSLDITFARLGGVVTVTLLAQSQIATSVVLLLVMALLAVVCVLKAVPHGDDLRTEPASLG